MEQNEVRTGSKKTKTTKGECMQKMIRAAVVTAMIMAPVLAFAAPKITMQIKATKEVTVKQNGKNVTKMMPVKGVSPGDVITYTISYKNEGDELAKDVVINDPIPAGSSYLAETAEGKGADITYSIDKGKTYNKPTILSYEAATPGGKSEKRVATPDDYTHIRWVVESVPAGGSGKVSFKVKVK